MVGLYQTNYIGMKKIFSLSPEKVNLEKPIPFAEVPTHIKKELEKQMFVLISKIELGKYISAEQKIVCFKASSCKEDESQTFFFDLKGKMLLFNNNEAIFKRSRAQPRDLLKANKILGLK